MMFSKLIQSFSVSLLFAAFAWADPYEALRDYKPDMVCKPFVETENGIAISDEMHWVTLPWKDLLGIGSNRLLFRYLDGVFTIPNKGFVCDHKDREQEIKNES